MFKVSKKVICFLLLLTSLPINAASFDCLKATTKIEKLICTSSELSALDETLAKAYSRAKTQTSNEAQLKREQIEWIKNRNSCSEDNCVKSYYLKRIKILERRDNKAEASSLEEFQLSNVNTSKSTEPLEIIGSFNEFRPIYGKTKFINGNLYFSQYGKSGNNYDLIALNIDSQTARYLAKEHENATFVAENDNYIVIQTKESTTSPLIVLNKEDGKLLGKVKIKGLVAWSKISDKSLTIIQSGMNKNHITFSLPDLKITEARNTPMQIDSNGITNWHEKLIILENDGLGIYDEDLKLLNIVEYRKYKPQYGNSCSKAPLQIVGNMAIVTVNCGEIDIYNLESGKWERTIPPYDSFYSLTSYKDEFLFSSPITKSLPKNHVRIFNILTGKETAIVPVAGSYLFATDKHLLTFNYDSKKSSTITIYKINDSIFRSEDYYIHTLMLACNKAIDAAKNGDIYKAIDLCEAAGMKEVSQAHEVKPELAKYIKAYGEWLSLTYSRASESVNILSKFLTESDSKSLTNRIIEANLKSRYFTALKDKANSVSSEKTIHSLSPEEIETDFGKAISKHPLKIHEVTIDFGSFSNLFYFDKDRVYIGKWSPELILQIYNRKDFSLIKSVIIDQDPNEETQPEITSITSDSLHIYISIARRWKDDSNIDFVIVDKKSLEIINKYNIGIENLFSYQGKIYSCGCESNASCNSINLGTLSLSKEDGFMCKSFSTYDQASLIELDNRGKDVDNNGNLIVANGQGDLPIHHKSEYPKISMATKTKGLNTHISIKLNHLDEEKTLMDLNHTPNSAPKFLLHKDHLFIGNDRDLLIYDVMNNQLKYYIKDFTASEADSSRCCIDFNKIARFIVDGNRLIVLTQNGVKSKIVDLTSI